MVKNAQETAHKNPMIFQAIASTELVLRVPMSDWEMAWRCHGNVRKPRFLRIFTARILLFYPFLPILGVCFIFFWTEREWDNIMHCSWFRHIYHLKLFETMWYHLTSFVCMIVYFDYIYHILLEFELSLAVRQFTCWYLEH